MSDTSNQQVFHDTIGASALLLLPSNSSALTRVRSEPENCDVNKSRAPWELHVSSCAQSHLEFNVFDVSDKLYSSRGCAYSASEILRERASIAFDRNGRCFECEFDREIDRSIHLPTARHDQESVLLSNSELHLNTLRIAGLLSGGIYERNFCGRLAFVPMPLGELPNKLGFVDNQTIHPAAPTGHVTLAASNAPVTLVATAAPAVLPIIPSTKNAMVENELNIGATGEDKGALISLFIWTSVVICLGLIAVLFSMANSRWKREHR